MSNVQAPYFHGLLLAAGASRRFGQAKQLAKLNGQSLIRLAIEGFSNSNLHSFTVVLGANSEAIRNEIDDKVNILFAENWHYGMGASIADSIQKLPEACSHVLIGLADQVAIREKQCNLLIERATKHPSCIVASRFHHAGKERIGAPAIFPRSIFPDLATLRADKGAKDIIANAVDVIEVDMAEASIDVDTPSDLLQVQASLEAKKRV
ncbi:nucleotidyltransferase family protein [Glaciecola sp. MH2013]|uniref:nucleotidyltransferase family protein n=1 Tax=Glaciecola sp. MH2013 TaxID=2785524 RepID=UPI00189F2E64|nr:nucleotidyltransferase family protein [Glaciecola sp. MH2013]MBF7074246.1 nucleotidyltransferase family protein [Glaciecola sp. MH2013]